MLVDTDIFICGARGNHSALQAIENATCTGATNCIEYMQGCRNKKELSHFELLLESLAYEILDITTQISMTARMLTKQYALSHGMQLGDALVAATCLAHNKVLLTANAKHFKYIPGLEVQAFKP